MSKQQQVRSEPWTRPRWEISELLLPASPGTVDPELFCMEGGAPDEAGCVPALEIPLCAGEDQTAFETIVSRWETLKREFRSQHKISQNH